MNEQLIEITYSFKIPATQLLNLEPLSIHDSGLVYSAAAVVKKETAVVEVLDGQAEFKRRILVKARTNPISFIPHKVLIIIESGTDQSHERIIETKVNIVPPDWTEVNKLPWDTCVPDNLKRHLQSALK